MIRRTNNDYVDVFILQQPAIVHGRLGLYAALGELVLSEIQHVLIDIAKCNHLRFRYLDHGGQIGPTHTVDADDADVDLVLGGNKSFAFGEGIPGKGCGESQPGNYAGG